MPYFINNIYAIFHQHTNIYALFHQQHICLILSTTYMPYFINNIYALFHQQHICLISSTTYMPYFSKHQHYMHAPWQVLRMCIRPNFGCSSHFCQFYRQRRTVWVSHTSVVYKYILGKTANVILATSLHEACALSFSLSLSLSLYGCIRAMISHTGHAPWAAVMPIM